MKHQIIFKKVNKSKLQKIFFVVGANRQLQTKLSLKMTLNRRMKFCVNGFVFINLDYQIPQEPTRSLSQPRKPWELQRD